MTTLVAVDLLDKHAQFHREVGRVAQSVDGGRKDESLPMVDSGTPFAKAAQATVMALRTLQLAAAARPSRRAPRPRAAARSLPAS